MNRPSIKSINKQISFTSFIKTYTKSRTNKEKNLKKKNLWTKSRGDHLVIAVSILWVELAHSLTAKTPPLYTEQFETHKFTKQTKDVYLIHSIKKLNQGDSWTRKKRACFIIILYQTYQQERGGNLESEAKLHQILWF